MILILAGTAEGRQTAKLLQDLGFRITVSVVSNYAAQLLRQDGVNMEIARGALDKSEFYKQLGEKEISVIIDATHPYATQISLLTMEAANKFGLKYIRLERESCQIPQSPLISKIEDIIEIEKFLSKGQNVFSTLGSKSLPVLMPVIKKTGANLIARVLPTAESIEVCKNAGISPENIVALKGPFPKYLNKSLFKYYQADLILTKESGDTGGFKEKIEAALELAIPVLVLTRPKLNYPLVVNSPQEVVDYLNDL
jgi:precorrin-6A/cobalt-precorrin-6A reductase